MHIFVISLIRFSLGTFSTMYLLFLLLVGPLFYVTYQYILLRRTTIDTSKRSGSTWLLTIGATIK